MKSKVKNRCPVCGGEKIKGKTTVTVDLDTAVIVVRKVPAMICSICGADWIDDKTTEKIEQIVNQARKKKLMVEVTTM